MISLARSSLRYEWRRYIAAVLAVAFAGLLVIMQLALLLGVFSTVSVPLDASSAQLWIGFRNTPSVDLGRSVSAGSDARAWMHPATEYVERFVNAYGDLRRADGVPVSVVINGIDTSDNASAFSRLISSQQRALLREPGAVLIDEADVAKLGAKNGAEVEINGKKARLADTVRGLRVIGGVSVLSSLSTAGKLAPETNNSATFYLVRLKPGYSTKVVKKDISDTNTIPRYSVWEAGDFSTQSQLYWLLESGIGIGFGFASLLALLVGVVITSQTLSAAVTGSIKEFAALRALGVARQALRLVVIEQAAWIGLAGLALATGLTCIIAFAGNAADVSLRFPIWLTIGTGMLVMLIALGSGVLALRPLLQAEPATLLR